MRHHAACGDAFFTGSPAVGLVCKSTPEFGTNAVERLVGSNRQDEERVGGFSYDETVGEELLLLLDRFVLRSTCVSL